MLLEFRQKALAEALLKAVDGCDAGMKNGIAYYRNASNPAEKEGLFKRAVRLPYRREFQIQQLLTKRGAPYLNTALARITTLQLSDLAAVLAPLKVYSDLLVDRFQNQGWTIEQIAQDIETTREDIDSDPNLPFPGWSDDFPVV